MAEEQVSNSGVEGGDGGSRTPAQSTESLKEQEVKDAQLKIYAKLNQAYNDNPEVKKVLDHILQGKSESIKEIFAEKQEEIKTAEVSGDTNEVASLRKELEDMRKVFNGFKDFTESTNIINARSGIDQAYLNEFDRMAKEKGFDRNFAGYDELFDLVTVESKKIASKFGLTVKDARGNEIPDLLLGYKKELLQEAFDAGKKRLDRMGFDVDEIRVRETKRKNMEAEEQKRKAILENFKPGMTRAERGRVFNKLAHDILRRKGLSLSDIR